MHTPIKLRPCQEYLTRPTAPAHWWESPNQNVLGGRDLLRKEQGTWLGMTKQGRIAVLTNFREEGIISQEARSRGAMVNAFLTQPAESDASTEDFIESLVEGEGLKGVGGFSLVCGGVGEALAVISNRTPNIEGITWIAKDAGETVGLSNAAFADRSWLKVLRGEGLLESAVIENFASKGSQASLIDDMFQLLGDDTLPKRSNGQVWVSYVMELRHSILIPAIDGEGVDDLSAEDLAAAKSNNQGVNVVNATGKAEHGDGLSGVYGTQKQTVVLVDHHGRVTFVERSLFDATGRATRAESSERDRRYEFDIEGWNKP